MACDALADRRERISGKLFQDVVESVNRLLRERPRQRRIVPRRAFDTIDVEEERSAGGHRLHEDRCGSGNQRRHTQQIAGSNVAHGDLAAISGMHVDAQQAPHDDGQSFGVRFRIDGVAGGEFDDPSTVDERFDGSSRDRSPTSASEQSTEAHGREVTRRLIRRHRVRLERNRCQAPLNRRRSVVPELVCSTVERCGAVPGGLTDEPVAAWRERVRDSTTRQSHAPQQIVKPRVVAQRIQLRLYP